MINKFAYKLKTNFFSKKEFLTNYGQFLISTRSIPMADRERAVDMETKFCEISIRGSIKDMGQQLFNYEVKAEND